MDTTTGVELAGMILFTIFGLGFFIAVWTLVLRERRKEEPPPASTGEWRL
jgi:cbb3-type cytochrome oxidase subunit 3